MNEQLIANGLYNNWLLLESKTSQINEVIEPKNVINGISTDFSVILNERV